MVSLVTALRKANRDRGSSVTPEAAPLLDQATLHSLLELEKRAAEPFLSRLIDRFLNGMADEVALVTAEWLADHLEKTEAAAHALAGAAATVGAGALSRAAQRMCESPDDLYMVELTSVAEQTGVALLAWRDDFALLARALPTRSDD